MQGAGGPGFKSNVPAVLEQLQLQRCADTLIGNSFVRGTSGGEKRRVAIGEALVRANCKFHCDTTP